MSAMLVRQALETALAAMSPALSTAYENAAFTPVAGTPYQKASILFAQPDNTEYGSAHVEQGFMQVDLRYPAPATGVPGGTAAVTARAELIRSTFRRGATFTVGGIVVTVQRTPEIMPGYADGDRWVVPVRIRFFAPVP